VQQIEAVEARQKPGQIGGLVDGDVWTQDALLGQPPREVVGRQTWS